MVLLDIMCGIVRLILTIIICPIRAKINSLNMNLIFESLRLIENRLITFLIEKDIWLEK